VFDTDVEGGEIHLNSIFPSGCGFSTWTSETRGAKAAMGYDLRSAYEYWLAKENNGFPSAVRLVRQLKSKSENTDGEPRFVNNGDGTVTDNETQLMWKESDSYLDLDKWVSWGEAKSYILGVNQDRYAGCVDWRMPTRKEVQTIFDPSNPVTDKYGLYFFPCWHSPINTTCISVLIHPQDITFCFPPTHPFIKVQIRITLFPHELCFIIGHCSVTIIDKSGLSIGVF
jgi:hypothetical protein